MILSDAWTKQAHRFVVDFARRAGWRGPEAVLLMVLGALAEGLGLALLIPLLTLLAGAGGKAQRIVDETFAALGVEGRLAPTMIVLGGFCLVIILRSLILAVRDRRLAALQVGFVEAQRTELVRALAAAGWSEVAGLRHARVTDALSTGVSRVAGGAFALMSCTAALVMLAGHMTLALLLAPAMGAAALALLAVGALALLPVLRSAGAVGRLFADRQLQMMHAAGQLLGGLKLAIAQNLQGRFIGEFEQTTAALGARQLSFMRQQSNLRIGVSTVAAVGGGLLVLAGVWLEVEGPVLIGMLLILSRMLGPAMQLQQGLQQLAYNLSSYEELSALTDELERVRETAPSESSPPLPEGPVVFSGVGYRYSDGGLEGLDLVLEPGEIVGVGGPSGAGKTTFADLLAGLLAPRSGAITVGGMPLAGAARAAWRDQIAYVAQETYLFNDSLRRALTWAAPEAGEAELWAALETAGAADLVRRMERGLDTELGERGVRLSGGERQRIALARAVLRRARLLILDEATSALDLASERAALERLLALQPRPGLVIIAHRPETLSICDRVLIFQDGRLASDHRAAVAGVTG